MAKKMPCIKCGKCRKKIPPFTICECCLPPPKAAFTVPERRRERIGCIEEAIATALDALALAWDIAGGKSRVYLAEAQSLLERAGAKCGRAQKYVEESAP